MGANRTSRLQNLFWNRALRHSGTTGNVAGRASRPRPHLTRSIHPGHSADEVRRAYPAAAPGVEEREPRGPANPPGPPGTRRTAGGAWEPPGLPRRRPTRRPRARPPPDDAAGGAADLFLVAAHHPTTRRAAARPGPLNGAPAGPPHSRTPSHPPHGKQGQGTTPLSPSPPITVTMHTPDGRQRCAKGRRPLPVAAINGDQPHAGRPTALPEVPPTSPAAAFCLARRAAGAAGGYRLFPLPPITGTDYTPGTR